MAAVSIAVKAGREAIHRVSTFVAIVGLTVSLLSAAMAQPAAPPATEAPVVPEAPVVRAPAGKSSLIVTPYGKKMVAFDGLDGTQPTPLLWAEGITQTSQLDAYAATGFNTVVVHLPWRLQPDGSLLLTDLDAPREFAKAAAERGLHVIYGLPPAPLGMEMSFRTSADSNAYFTLWSTWNQAAMQTLRDTPGLMGWMLPDDPRSLHFCDDVGFGHWLQANYANVGILNHQWNTNFATFNEITFATAHKTITEWKGFGAITTSMTNEELLERIQAENQRPANQNFAFHPASLALAIYQWEAYRNLLDRWAQVVRAADSGHIVFTGRLTDYAQLLSVPGDIDVSIADLKPGVAENDWTTHNPQAIDIARRGGRFAALPVFSTSSPNGPGPDAAARLVGEWADEALAHGASGLIFASWQEINGSLPLAKAVHDTLARLCKPPCLDLWQQPPAATSAVVLTPLADGYTLQLGPANLPGAARGLYGFSEDMVPGEPSDLVYDFRWGTAFGSVDFLSCDDIEGAGAQLRHYSTLFLPQALSVSQDMTLELNRYVMQGGTIVADLGLGAAQTAGRVLNSTDNGQAIGMTPLLSQLFGVAPALQLRMLSFNAQFLTPHPMFPTWMHYAEGRPGVDLTRGDAPNNAAFAGPVLYGLVPQDTYQLAQAPQVPEHLATTSTGELNRLLRAPITLHEVGNGCAIFVPFRMWNYWHPGEMGFDAFHGDLLSRGAAMVVFGVNNLTPLALGRSNMSYPEAVNFPSSVVLLNHNTPLAPEELAGGSAGTLSDGLMMSTVRTTGSGNFLWSNAICGYPATTGEGTLAAGRPAPIADPNEFESSPHIVELNATSQAGTATVMNQLPVRVVNNNGRSIMAYARECNGLHVALDVWPNAATVVNVKGDMEVQVGSSGTAHLTLYNGIDRQGYLVAPGSRHRIAYHEMVEPLDRSKAHPPVSFLATADAQGRLGFDVTGQAMQVDISPAP